MQKLRRVYVKAQVDSALLCDKIKQLGLMYKSIMAYMPINNECDLTSFMETALLQGCSVSIPYIDQNDVMHSGPIATISDVTVGKYGIAEPLNRQSVSIDCIFVPGVVFDRMGGRIGYGKGYYDRFLQNTPAIKIGCAYDFQVLDSITHERHDCFMDMVITPSRIFERRCG